MDVEEDKTDKSSSSQDTVTNGAYPVHCTEELLRPFFTDESLQVAMKPKLSPSPRPAADRGPVSPLFELRLVLLGRKGAGKSAAGNTILGGGFEAGKPTEECVKRRADVAGRKVTVVDTPGWEWYYPLNSTPNWVRRETLRSVSLCPPGPHAVLLVVRSRASVNEDYITEIGEHLELLGTNVWEHTAVLFTRGDELGLTSMEQRIQTSGPGLQTLLKKCGNRYHVVENRAKGDGTQVKELIKKLEEMVSEKEERCKHLEMDAALLLELEADGKRRVRERRKKQRQMEAQVQRGTIKTALMSDSLQISESDTRQSFSKTSRRLPEVRLVLLGERETGKSSAANVILGQPGLFESGTVTEECVRHQAALSMRQVTVVDTPGWDGGVMGSTPERVKREIVSSVELCPPGPHALLVTLRVDTVVRESHVREHLELLGEGVWRYAILLFTHGDQLREGVDIEQHIQKGGKDLQSLLEKCRGRYHMISSFNGLQNKTQVIELLEKVEEMAARNRCEAFSGLVQEVKTLSRQRNEKFNQRFKELQDKMLRQEAELKNMRDREMKSLRWFFDRKKKVKSPGNLKKEEEDEEEKRSADRKYDIEELEERMRLLTEDKEREIQDLNAEHERIIAALHQSRREAEEAGLNLELKEREIEELKERIDEQQVKTIDLERIAVGHERERKRNEEAVKEWEKVVHSLQQNMNLVKAEWKERVVMLKTEMDEAKKQYEKELGRTLFEKNNEINEQIKQTEIMLNEKDKERKIMMEEKQRALDRVKENEEEMQRKVEEMTRQHQKEINEVQVELKEEMEKMLEMVKGRHAKETDAILKEHHIEIKEKLKEIETLKEKSAKEAKSQMEIKQRELDELEQKYLEIMKEKLCESEKEKEIIWANHKKEISEKDNDMFVLKEQHQEEMTREKWGIEKAVRDEMALKVKEKEDEVEIVKGKYAAEMLEYEKSKERFVLEIEDLKCKYMEGIKEKDKETEQILKEKEKEIEELRVRVEELKQKLEKQMVELDRMKEMQTKLENREKEVSELQERWHATRAEKEQEMKLIEQILEEKERLIQQLHEKLKDIEQMLREKEDERGQILLNQKKEVELQLQVQDKEMDEMKQQLLKETERYVESVKMLEKQTREMAEVQSVLASKEAEIEEAVKTQEKYVRENEELKERVKSYSETQEQYRNKEAEMTEKLQEKEKDLDQMRLRTEQTKAELNELTRKMEKEMTSMIQEYERGIERRNEEIEVIVKEKDAVIRSLEKDKQEKVLEVTEKYEESQKRIEEVEVKTAEEIKELQMKCEQLRKECEAKGKEVQVKEREIENICKSKDQEVWELGEINQKLQTEMERMKEMFEKEMSELKEQVKEKQLEVNLGENDLAEKFKEIEIWEKEKQEFEQNVLKFDSKCEELKQREMALEAKQKEEKDRRRNIEQKEKELEKLLEALEAKQTELNFHGEDLQKKVKGFKGQGKELKDREVDLRQREQELMNWTSELNVQNEQVNSTAQQLDAMGRDLALLKEELQRKEKNLKTMSKNLNKWEMSLQEREAGINKRRQSDLENGKCEEEVVELKETGKDGTREDQSVKKMADVLSAKGNNCHFESLQEIEGLEMQKERAEVIRGPRSNKESRDQVLTVVMLRESWSRRSPAGVSLLGGVSEPNGSSLGPWRGQIAGRRVSVVEPLGLKWRDGPNTSEQSQNVIEALSWCETGPDVVLLVIPAFLTCTEMYRKAIEEQVGLAGNEVWRRTMVLFTWGETLGARAEQHVQRNGELGRLIEKCGGRFHVLRSKKNKAATEELIDKLDDIAALNKREELVA